jgi:hypothetical protein
MISSPKNLAQPEKYKDISRRLALRSGLDDATAKAPAREGKAIVHVDGGLHSSWSTLNPDGQNGVVS